jgi:hypothetical protein
MKSYVSNSTRRLTTILGDFSKANNLPSAYERAEAVLKAREQNPDFLKIRQEAVRQNYLEKARSRMLLGAQQELRYYEELDVMAKSNMENPEWLLVNPQEIKSNMFIVLRQARQRVESLKGPIQLTDSITGESHSINVTTLFNKDTMADLFSFFPSQRSNYDRLKEIEGRGADVYKWNYYYGRPESFPDPTFGGLLVGAVNPSTDNALSPQNVRNRMYHAQTQAATGYLSAFLNFYQ